MGRVYQIWFAAAGGLIVLCSCVGCWGRPDAPDWPALKPADAARKAMELYDTNKDGVIDAEEIKRSPALMEAVLPAEGESKTPMDENGDGRLTEEEIRERVAAWLRTVTPIETQSTIVTLGGRPLQGATVTYEPEPFLSPPLESTSAVTDENGYCFPKGQDAKFPGIYVGLYRVRISKQVDGKETILPRYNTETILGKEVASDAPSTHRLLEFHLKRQ